MIPLAAAFGLKAGFVALGIAAIGGNMQALKLARLKMMLIEASQKMGGFFYCDDCGKDADITDVFRQL